MAFVSSNILDVFGLDWVSMLFYLGNFILLLAVVIPLIYIPTKKMLKKKRESLDEVYNENERLKKESEEAKAEYDKKVEEFKLESARAAAKVADAAQARANAVIEEAQEKAQAMISSAKKEAATQMEQLKGEYRDSVNTLAVQIAQKLLEREISDKDNSVLIEQVLSDWEDAD
ncbi:MAG: ATP synthase F0 subunit B [Clostridiales bacterium]|nr:ATP synthase F0 subunit B [Clostridiales bacterium]